MNSKRNITGVLAVFCGALAIAAQSLFGASSQYVAANTTANYNLAVDTHKHMLSRQNDAAITTRHLLYKEGTTAGVTVAVAGAGDAPLGTIDNTESLTGASQNVFLLGTGWTTKMIASSALSIGANVYGGASGKVVGVAALTAGTWWHVGRLLTASSADGDVVEVESCKPRKIVVIANGSTLSQTQAVMLDGATVIVLAS
jgi:D-arabinose 1-dehydrogenase-like Zn-dependent alcohol dehydrogenase